MLVALALVMTAAGCTSEAPPADLLLTDSNGDVVIDPGWPDEALLDTSDADKRDRIAEVMGDWIDDCQTAIAARTSSSECSPPSPVPVIRPDSNT